MPSRPRRTTRSPAALGSEAGGGAGVCCGRMTATAATSVKVVKVTARIVLRETRRSRGVIRVSRMAIESSPLASSFATAAATSGSERPATTRCHRGSPRSRSPARKTAHPKSREVAKNVTPRISHSRLRRGKSLSAKRNPATTMTKPTAAATTSGGRRCRKSGNRSSGEAARRPFAEASASVLARASSVPVSNPTFPASRASARGSPTGSRASRSRNRSTRCDRYPSRCSSRRAISSARGSLIAGPATPVAVLAHEIDQRPQHLGLAAERSHRGERELEQLVGERAGARDAQ